MQRKQTRNLAITALFVAIFLLQTFVPNIGYIRILPALPAITTVPLTVAIYSLLMGPRAGAIFGLFWGGLRLYLAITQPGDMVSLMLFRNPIIAVLPSVLAGLFSGMIGQVFAQKSSRIKEFSYIGAGAIASLTNTIMVILLTSIIFMHNSTQLIGYLGNFDHNIPLIKVLFLALGLNGLVEMIFTAIVTPIVVSPLLKVLHRLS
ncbi:Uncharacterized membrane protein [Lactobacillus bombicola]|jgi:uncharacterized membrane protein|uniref:ECF transporter S component n=1 Tax=Lactobacillus bombicola TaxID=1505723 RepID=A0A1I1TKK2_9LACO|nr:MULTISPECIES: ECF transporter S component [Lactobacillus]RHW49404.1 ECF transporter S component [Lactobacillus bombicola]RHW53222.1 ECF transporter S component [Lactobacillus bombicola]RHW55177.1 ECF transporter S component [Lactobacillus bombicola]RMC42746.1 ECF transporter S component [Lactobacillus sp. ESL0233]SFD59057.1 Uncharacterized membrane protein [Lactobacillus bombicola]